MDSLRFDPNSTRNEGRWRLLDPKEFEKNSYYRWSNHGGEKLPDGVQIVGGTHEELGPRTPQAIRFDKRKWSEERAAEWWEQNQQRFTKRWTPAHWVTEADP